MSEKHTPGPWRRDAACGGLAIESEKHGNIGLVNLARASMADARLIAAAPELLEALHEIAKGEGAFSRDQLTHATNTIEIMVEIARAAIAKAEEQP